MKRLFYRMFPFADPALRTDLASAMRDLAAAMEYLTGRVETLSEKFDRQQRYGEPTPNTAH
jgi:hypothetical protein